MLEGRSVLEEPIPIVSLGWNTGQAWYLLFIESFDSFAGLLWIKGLCLSICAVSPCCLGFFPHAIRLCQSQG